MIILNTTFILDPAVSAEALSWIRHNFINGAQPAPMLARVHAHESQPDCETYALHLHFDDLDAVQAWHDDKGAALLGQMADRWGERALCFQTLLEVID